MLEVKKLHCFLLELPKANSPRSVKNTRICLLRVRGSWLWLPLATSTCSGSFLCYGYEGG